MDSILQLLQRRALQENTVEAWKTYATAMERFRHQGKLVEDIASAGEVIELVAKGLTSFGDELMRLPESILLFYDINGKALDVILPVDTSSQVFTGYILFHSDGHPYDEAENLIISYMFTKALMDRQDMWEFDFTMKWEDENRVVAYFEVGILRRRPRT